MAETVVNVLMDQLGSIVRENLSLVRKAGNEVPYIKEELERMAAFLRTSDEKEQTDPELKVWIKQVREVAYDTNDVLDEFVLHLTVDHGAGCYGYLCKIVYFIMTIEIRRQIAVDLVAIKSRVERISADYDKYSTRFGISRQGSNHGNNYISNDNDNEWSDAHLLEETDLVGINDPKENLIELLLKDDPVLVGIAVVGAGGCGKTTLVKQIYDDVGVKNNYDSHAWLTISQTYNLNHLMKDLVQQLLQQIRQPIPQGLETMSTTRIQALIREFLKERKYFIVIDDVWGIQAWDALSNICPKNNFKSRVILTTRDDEIASSFCGNTNGCFYPLSHLSDEDSWTLFCRHAFQGNPCPSHLKNISQKILNMCDGLPLAIVAIGGMLAIKSKSDSEKWEMLYRSMSLQLQTQSKLQKMKNVLYRSYYDLLYYHKICFLYLSVFPEDTKIETMRFIRLLIAEGFARAGDGMTAEEVAENHLMELVHRNLIQVEEKTLDGRLKSFRIHDLFHKILSTISRDQNIVTIVTRDGTEWPEKVRRVSICGADNLVGNNSFSRLRSLFLFEDNESVSIASPSKSLLTGGCKLLKVLDCRYAPIETIPGELFELYHLRYLSLRGTKVKVIPKSISNLRNLETLDLKGTLVQELPDSILMLHRLRHLLVCRYSTLVDSKLNIGGFNIPSTRIGSLESLQKLYFIEAERRGFGETVSELGKLRHLRRLGILRLREEDGSSLCCSIGQLVHLRSLILSSIYEDKILDLQHPMPSTSLRFLRSLTLEGRLEDLPEWISSLDNLVRVSLFKSGLKKDPLPFFKDLPKLMEMRLNEAFEGEELCFVSKGFQALKKLQLKRLTRLRTVAVEDGAMSHLQELRMASCTSMMRFPDDIVENRRSLQLLELDDMSYDLVKPLLKEYSSARKKMIERISKVSIGSWLNGEWVEWSLINTIPERLRQAFIARLAAMKFLDAVS